MSERGRRHPILVATRVDARERALIDAAARSEGVTVSGLLRRIVLPEVADRVSQAAAELRAPDGSSRPE